VKTYRIASAAWCYTPGLVRAALHQFAFDPEWSIRLLHKGLGLPIDVAQAVASGSLEYRLDGETVVIEVAEVAL
jgi:hypothetical protein